MGKTIIYSGSIGVGKTYLLSKKSNVSQELIIDNKDLNIAHIMKSTYVDGNLKIKDQLKICKIKLNQLLNTNNEYLDRGPFDRIVFGILYFEFIGDSDSEMKLWSLFNKYRQKYYDIIKSKINSVWIVKCSFETVMARIQKRNREEEIHAYKPFLKYLHENFPILMKRFCERFYIYYEEIDNDK